MLSENINMNGIKSESEWILFRFMPVLFLTIGLSCLLSLIRSKSVFVPGIQGMILGGIIGWLWGLISRRDPDRWVSFSQRIWLSLSMMIVYGTAHLSFLSLLHSGAIDPPLYWLMETINGFEKEAFIGIGKSAVSSGRIGGGWWLLFNLIDFGLFAFLFLAFSRVGLNPDTPEDNESDQEESEDEEPEEDVRPEPESSQSAFGMFWLIMGVLAIAMVGYWEYGRLQEGNPYSMENLNEIKQLEGRWKIDKGGRLFGGSEESWTVQFTAVGFNMLRGVPDTGLPCFISIDKRGRNFSGQVYFTQPEKAPGNSKLPIPVRARFSKDHQTITMVFTVWNIYGRKEPVVTGKRMTE